MDNVTYSVYMLLEENHHTCFTTEILLFETALCGFFYRYGFNRTSSNLFICSAISFRIFEYLLY